MSRLVIEAGKADRHYWRDVWHFRELFYFLSWRDILVRYKQTVIGVLWAIIRPVLTAVVFAFVFGKLAKLPSAGVPYIILVFAGMLPWQFFAAALTEASNSLIGNANMISKIYFPRIIVPGAAMIVALIDFLISLGILAILMAGYQILPTWRLLFIPAFITVAFFAAFGAGLWLAALNVKYRDFRYILPFIVQIGLYISPVGFSSKIVPENWKAVYSLNPMVGVIDGFRWAITGAQSDIWWPGFVISNAIVMVLAVSGLAYFRRTERAFADII